MKKYQKYILLSSMFAITLTASGCGKANNINIELTDQEFKIAAYATPPNGSTDGAQAPYGKEPNYNTLENWQILADAGFNYAIPIWYDYKEEHIINTLDNASKVGVKVIIEDRVSPGLPNLLRGGKGITYDMAKSIIKASESGIKERYDNFKKYDSFAGIVAIDEPSADYYNAIQAGQDWWYENYPEYLYHVNLFPSYSTRTQLFGSQPVGTYKDYVEQFIQASNPAELSYDFYCLKRAGLKGEIHPNWLSDLETYALLSKEYKIPFSLYVLITQHLNNSAVNNYREIAWQVYSAMAYGARGINTFMYWSYMIPEVNTDNLGTSLVDAEGNKMPAYYACQELFGEIKSFDELYMGFEWEKTKTIGLSGNGTYSNLINKKVELDGIVDVEATEDALIGQFKDKNNNKAYMVMNYSSPYTNTSNTVSLTFDNVKEVLICKKGRIFRCNIKKNKLDLNIGSGEGFFLVPIR